jgi:hypothetical protein
MVCQACGSPVQGAFCSRCGAAVVAPPANPVAAMYAPPPVYPYAVPEQRVQRHVQTLGILWCVYGGYRAITGILGALFLAGISTGGFMGGWERPGIFPFMSAPWMAGLAGFIAVITMIFAALSFLVGFSLLTRKPWGRTLAIVIAILQLIKIPFGTALGIYTLWVLAPSPSGAEYDAIAARP